MSNWEYANDVPTTPWRSAMSVPRSLSLRNVEKRWRLLQQPVKELQSLRGSPSRAGATNLTGDAEFSNLNGSMADSFEMLAEFESTADAKFFITLRTGENEQTLLHVDIPNHKLTLDRTRSGKVDFHKQFAGTASAPVRLIAGRLKLHILVDTSSIEVFANDGETVLTSLIFPSPGERRLDLHVAQGSLQQANLTVWKLKSAWSDGE
jgi:fructan beta-fructosidase